MEPPRTSSSPTWFASARAPFALEVDGVAVGPAWLTRTAAERRTGLLGTRPLPGALLIDRCSSVHTFGMAYALDVAFLARDGRVLATTTMPRARLGRPRLRARSVLEVPAGGLRAWGIVPGSGVRLVAVA